MRAHFFHLLFRIDRAYDRLRRWVRGKLGMQRRLVVLAHRGFGSSERACVSARIQEARPGGSGPTHARGWLASALSSYRRYATVEIPGAQVRVRWGSRVEEHRTDEEGFLRAWMTPPPEAALGGDARAEIEVLCPRDEPPVRADAVVQVVSPAARFGVICDIDDTVIVTHVPSLWRRSVALFLTDMLDRQPFEGMTELLAALSCGVSGTEGNPIFYVSSSPWNLHQHLEELFVRHEIPPGPLLLRDWGLSRDGFAPDGRHDHKREKIEEVLEALPELPFLLVGDSGQADAVHYAEIARSHPERVLAIAIRRVPCKPERLERIARLTEELAVAGKELFLFDDSAAAMRRAAEHGWIPAGGGSEPS